MPRQRTHRRPANEIDADMTRLYLCCVVLGATLAGLAGASTAQSSPPLRKDLISATNLLVPAAVSETERDTDLIIDDDVQRERLVAEIQEQLTELGLYGGAVDGIFGPGTDRAIRLYQAQTKLPIDGKATRALLKHLQTVGEANRLVERIARVKGQNIDRARSALAQQSRTRDLLSRERLQPANPLRDASGCLAAPTTGCLLDEALESAKAVADRKFRDWALGDIVVAQIKAGFAALAFDTVGRIDDPRLIIAGLRNIAQAEAARGRLSESRAMADIIPDPWNQLQAKASVALAEAKAGDAAALLTAREIAALSQTLNRPARSAAALSQLAIGLRKAGAGAAADLVLEEAQEITNGVRMTRADRDNSLSEIAIAVAEGGDFDGAMEVIAGIEEDALRRPALLAAAGVFAREGAGGRALEAAAKIRDARYRSVALSEVAIALVRSGNSSRARDIVERALDDSAKIDARFGYAKGYAVSRAASAFVELGALPRAFDAARKIEDHSLRAKSFWLIAAAQARSGDRSAARTFERAHAAADAIKSPLDRAWTYCSIAVQSAKAGEDGLAAEAYAAARDLAATIRSPWARANVFTKLATTLVELQ